MSSQAGDAVVVTLRDLSPRREVATLRRGVSSWFRCARAESRPGHPLPPARRHPAGGWSRPRPDGLGRCTRREDAGQCRAGNEDRGQERGRSDQARSRESLLVRAFHQLPPVGLLRGTRVDLRAALIRPPTEARAEHQNVVSLQRGVGGTRLLRFSSTPTECLEPERSPAKFREVDPPYHARSRPNCGACGSPGRSARTPL